MASSRTKAVASHLAWYDTNLAALGTLMHNCFWADATKVQSRCTLLQAETIKTRAEGLQEGRSPDTSNKIIETHLLVKFLLAEAVQPCAE